MAPKRRRSSVVNLTGNSDNNVRPAPPLRQGRRTTLIDLVGNTSPRRRPSASAAQEQRLYRTPKPHYFRYGSNTVNDAWWMNLDKAPGFTRAYMRRTPPGGRVQVAASGNTGPSRRLPVKTGTLLGKGSFGAVYAKRATVDDAEFMAGLKYRVPNIPRVPVNATVALKVQVPQTAEDMQDAVDEAHIHAILDPLGFVPHLYGSGFDTQSGKHVTYMERVQGEPLADWLEKHHSVLPAQMFVQIERALASMWLAGVAHADVNGDNVMVTANGAIKIIDFGMSAVIPGNARPRNLADARHQGYQNKLMGVLKGRYQVRGMHRAAPDPHVLRYLYTLVPDKQAIPALRVLANAP